MVVLTINMQKQQRKPYRSITITRPAYILAEAVPDRAPE